jgi:hypothetical protein
VPPPSEQHVHRLLEEIHSGRGDSQRSLARRLGIALGLTNLLMRRVVRQGWVRMLHVRPNRVSYLLTPRGLAEKARMSRDYLVYSVHFYAEARDRIAERFQRLSAEWPENDGAPTKRIVFYGCGEVAEIGYICVQSTDLALVGVVADGPRTRFFGLDVRSTADLRPHRLGSAQFDRLVVMEFGARSAVERQLALAGYPAADVFWI